MPTAATSPPPSSAPEPPSHSPPPAPQIYTYHHICLTHILTTPYALPSLPTRAAPSLDNARILPLPSLDSPTLDRDSPSLAPPRSPSPSLLPNESKSEQQQEQNLPSLLHNLRPARKALVIQREDGWERRRVWRCGRCGVGVGYEIEGTDGGDGGAGDKREGAERLRVMYLLEGGLVETGEMMAGEGKGR